jgi:hypothetical protein
MSVTDHHTATFNTLNTSMEEAVYCNQETLFSENNLPCSSHFTEAFLANIVCSFSYAISFLHSLPKDVM